VLDRTTIQQRLLLCLYGLGTNLGLKRMCAGNIGVQADDLQYIRRRFITVDALRHAIGMVVNALFIIRDPAIWGHATTACASDSKKFGAWDQNLLTEWHARYQGPGVMIYWHVEKKSACIHSRLTRCSSSEVAAMIQGVLRHCTDMTIERQYVDSHGQSEIAFAFCRLLGFDLLPRLRPIHSQKLYRPEAGHPEAYPNLQLILTRPIDPMLIVPQYDEMIKFTTALVQGTADPEALLRRFQRTNVRHPTYRALAEFGKGSKTMFLCDYFMSEALRREIQEGLNVVESWNRANDVLFFGRGSEMATNRQEDLEVAMLCLHLLQICMVYVNTLLLQDLLLEPAWRNLMTVEDLGVTDFFPLRLQGCGVAVRRCRIQPPEVSRPRGGFAHREAIAARGARRERKTFCHTLRTCGP
jgi:TnpA family transposase